jgi:hypothetical protein
LGEFSIAILRLFSWLGSFLKIAKAAKSLDFLFHGKSHVCTYLVERMGWATFWAIFSQTHLVTLPIRLAGVVTFSEPLNDKHR